MEKYQIFFPCSSSMDFPSANCPIPIPTNNTDHIVSSQAYINSFDCDTSNGFLGLISSTENHVGLRRDLLTNNDDHRYQYQQQYSPTTTAIASNTNINKVGADHQGSSHHHQASGKKNKGEKKMRKAKYAFQTRSQVDILDDGYRWRKYGQKAVKNNKFPRSYYRCTYQGCNVKKQVQRLSKDEGIVVTTYEGMHTHPIEKPSDNFEHILSQMQIYTPF